MQANNAAVITTKPHMIKLKNLEYEAHQRNMRRLMMRTASHFGQSSEPIIRRKDKFLVYDKQQAQHRIDYENEILMKKIVRVSATDAGMMVGGIHQKKSMLEKQKRAEGRRIDSENKKLSIRIYNQTSSVGKDDILRQTRHHLTDLDRLSRIPKIQKVDNREEIRRNLEKLRSLEVGWELRQFTRYVQSSASNSQKQLPPVRGVFHSVASSHQLGATASSKASANTVSSAQMLHPKLEVVLGPQFREQEKGFLLKIEGTDFCFDNISESCTLTMTSKNLRRLEGEFPCTLTVLRINLDTLDVEPMGVKHSALKFSKKPTSYYLFCGPQLDQEFSLTLKLYT